MAEPTRLQLKEMLVRIYRIFLYGRARIVQQEYEERMEGLGHALLTVEIERDALREENRSLTMQLWEIRQAVAAYRTLHVQEGEATEEDMQLWEIRHVVAAYRALHVQEREAEE